MNSDIMVGYLDQIVLSVARFVKFTGKPEAERVRRAEFFTQIFKIVGFDVGFAFDLVGTATSRRRGDYRNPRNGLSVRASRNSRLIGICVLHSTLDVAIASIASRAMILPRISMRFNIYDKIPSAAKFIAAFPR